MTKNKNEDIQSSQESTSDEENPSKRFRLDENDQDPLKLPEPCVKNILQYFNGVEILELMEVSKYWKYYIESSNFLMNRAMDNVEVRFDRDKSLFVYEKSTELLKRNYKHARVVFPQVSINYADEMDHAVLGRYGFSFESLTLTVLALEENYQIQIKPVSFTKLKKLKIDLENDLPETPDQTLERFFTQSSFPEVTQLFFPLEIIRNEFVKELLLKFPKLKTLFISFYETDDLTTMTRFEQQPTLEFIALDNWSRDLLQTFSDSLTSVSLFNGCAFIEGNHGINFLMNLPNLVNLEISFDGYDDNNDEIVYTQNHKIETLTINDGTAEEIQRFLLAVPKLKVLTLSTLNVSSNTIKFLGNTYNIFNFLLI